MTHEERLALIMKPFPPILGGFRTVYHVRSYPWAGTIKNSRPIGDDRLAEGQRIAAEIAAEEQYFGNF